MFKREQHSDLSVNIIVTVIDRKIDLSEDEEEDVGS